MARMVSIDDFTRYKGSSGSLCRLSNLMAKVRVALPEINKRFKFGQPIDIDEFLVQVDNILKLKEDVFRENPILVDFLDSKAILH